MGCYACFLLKRVPVCFSLLGLLYEHEHQVPSQEVGSSSFHGAQTEVVCVVCVCVCLPHL